MITLTPDEVKGRNMWVVWTGGNDRLWDKLTNLTYGAFDLLKILSSSPGLKYSRDNRWNYLGLVNEPCFTKPTGPDPQRYGLWLDQRNSDCPADPFANEQKYPGVAVGARGKNIPLGSYYGYPTGILGLRLFPNPAFDQAAAARWNAERFYNDPDYYLSKDLVRPYRVGMSCGFCHVGPNPEKPPANPEAPQWENLSSTVGAQYFWVDRILAWNADQSNFLFQVLHTARPGSLDTSLVSSDNINNPRTMNAVYNLLPRLEAAKRFGRETLGPDNLANKQFNDFVSQGPLTQFFQPPNTVWTPHVLKDGSDSVGALGALNRVYVNIGLFSEEWLRHFNPIVGGKPVTPFAITTARKNSSYWQATEVWTPDMALFLIKASYPHKLRNAPGGAAYLNDPPETVQQGKLVFADNCAACHSSKAPERPAGADPAACIGPNYLICFSKYWAWTKTDAFRQQMRQIVMADDFLDGNFSVERRPCTGHLTTDQRLQPVGHERHRREHLGQLFLRVLQAAPFGRCDNGLRSVHRTAAAISRCRLAGAATRACRRWSACGPPRPYLLNNSVGRSTRAPRSRRAWGSSRIRSPRCCGQRSGIRTPCCADKVPGVIDRTTATSWLRIPTGYLPDVIKSSREVLNWLVPVFDQKGLEIGPIPEDTPVDLLANFEPLPPTTSLRERLAHDKAVVKVVVQLLHDLRALPQGASDEQARQVFANLGEQLFALSKCPDYVVNRGHYFGTELSDADKQALIAFLKTF